MGSLHKNIQLMLKFLKAPFLVLLFSYYTLMTFLMMLYVILLTLLMILLSLVLWSGIWSVTTTQLVSFDWSNNTGAINVKMDGSVLEQNHRLRCWGWLSLLSWIGAVTLFLLLKLHKLEPCFILWSFSLLRLLCISINLPYNHA